MKFNRPPLCVDYISCAILVSRLYVRHAPTQTQSASPPPPPLGSPIMPTHQSPASIPAYVHFLPRLVEMQSLDHTPDSTRACGCDMTAVSLEAISATQRPDHPDTWTSSALNSALVCTVRVVVGLASLLRADMDSKHTLLLMWRPPIDLKGNPDPQTHICVHAQEALPLFRYNACVLACHALIRMLWQPQLYGVACDLDDEDTRVAYFCALHRLVHTLRCIQAMQVPIHPDVYRQCSDATPFWKWIHTHPHNKALFSTLTEALAATTDMLQWAWTPPPKPGSDSAKHYTRMIDLSLTLSGHNATLRDLHSAMSGKPRFEVETTRCSDWGTSDPLHEFIKAYCNYHLRSAAPLATTSLLSYRYYLLNWWFDFFLPVQPRAAACLRSHYPPPPPHLTPHSSTLHRYSLGFHWNQPCISPMLFKSPMWQEVSGIARSSAPGLRIDPHTLHMPPPALHVGSAIACDFQYNDPIKTLSTLMEEEREGAETETGK